MKLMKIWVRLPLIRKHYLQKMTVAVKLNQLSTVKKLVDMGVDVNDTSFRVFSPLSLAILEGYNDIAAYLIDKGSDTNFAVVTIPDLTLSVILDIGKSQGRNTPEKYEEIRRSLSNSQLKKDRKNKLNKICLE